MILQSTSFEKKAHRDSNVIEKVQSNCDMGELLSEKRGRGGLTFDTLQRRATDFAYYYFPFERPEDN